MVQKISNHRNYDFNFPRAFSKLELTLFHDSEFCQDVEIVSASCLDRKKERFYAVSFYSNASRTFLVN